MLLSLTGASCAGKSTVLPALSAADWAPWDVRCAEFDSIGVPLDAGTAWRHGAVERWVRHALDLQADGVHLLLCGQVPIGELLAAPSADRLDGVAACVLHCSPQERAARLRARGEPEESIAHHDRFGAWFLDHARDPRHRPEVIRVPGTMRWERWDGASAWPVPVAILETTGVAPADTARRVWAWARETLQRTEGARVDA